MQYKARKGGLMKDITLENIYKKVVKIEREVAQIKKSLIEEPDYQLIGTRCYCDDPREGQGVEASCG